MIQHFCFIFIIFIIAGANNASFVFFQWHDNLNTKLIHRQQTYYVLRHGAINITDPKQQPVANISHFRPKVSRGTTDPGEGPVTCSVTKNYLYIRSSSRSSSCRCRWSMLKEHLVACLYLVIRVDKWLIVNFISTFWNYVCVTRVTSTHLSSYSYTGTC